MRGRGRGILWRLWFLFEHFDKAFIGVVDAGVQLVAGVVGHGIDLVGGLVFGIALDLLGDRLEILIGGGGGHRGRPRCLGRQSSTEQEQRK